MPYRSIVYSKLLLHVMKCLLLTQTHTNIGYLLRLHGHMYNMIKNQGQQTAAFCLEQ